MSLPELANLVSVQLSIPTNSDSTRPGIAANTPVPVIDKTSLDGAYDIKVDLKPEAGSDMFLLWQRILQDKFGLKLESQKAKIELLVVDRARRVPLAN